MSVRIKSALMKVKNSNGEYVDLDTLAVTQTTQEAISEIEETVAGVQDIVDDAETRAATVASTVSAAETAITNLENQKNDIVQSVASMAELGTDTTLSVSGMAADAKATGDAVNGLKSALNGYIYGVNQTFVHTGSTGWDYFRCLLLEGIEYTITNNNADHAMQARIYREDDSRIEIGTVSAGGTLKFIVPSDEFVRVGGYMYNGASFTVTNEYANIDSAENVRKDLLKVYCNTNIFNGAVFTSGSFVSVASLANTSINASAKRIHAQITIEEPLSFGMLIAILDSNYDYECGIFDADGVSLGYKSGWQTTDWEVTASKKIKYVRINIRKHDNSTILLYKDEICGFKDGFSSLKDAYNSFLHIADIERKIESDKGIIWNQMGSRFTRASGTLAGVTYTKSEDSQSITLDGTATTHDFFQLINSGIGTSIEGHQYALITPNINGSNLTYWFYINSRDARDYGDGVVWTATSATNIVIGIEMLAGTVFDNLIVEVPTIVDLTLMFGSGNEISLGQFKAMFPNKKYPYDAGTEKNLSRIEIISGDIYNNSNGRNITKLTVMTNNCGHFNYGSSSEYSGDDMQEKITEWKNMIARNKPDIILAQECSQYFDADETVNAFDTLYKPLLPDMYYFNYTKIFSKVKASRAWQLDLTVTIDGQTESRVNTCCDIVINGKTIGICSAHLSPGYDSHANAVREAQRDKIINAFSNYDYAIIGGDFNAQADSFYEAFTQSGYSIANHGYFGNINTFPNEPIDNIIIKGFLFYDAVSKAEDICTSDHQPLIADVLMQTT